ncbi:MAG: hypothetical protein ACXADC_16250, partial [Candidatus Thorarchaeota archaeon]
MIATTSNITSSSIRNRAQRLPFRLLVMSMMILFLCPVPGSIPNPSIADGSISRYTDTSSWTVSGDQTFEGSGASQDVTLNGVVTNDSQDLVLIDSMTPTPVTINAPQGWTGTSLGGTIDQISATFTPIKNGLLDAYHTERTIIPGSPWNAMEYNVPDNWNII